MRKILLGDCLEELKKLEDNSVDAVVTDPPYELGFMGKKWDASGIAYNVDLWSECLRVLKPGGHLLSFGGTRTYHRMACAIENAGFEIRDMLEWIYASGFSKSHNVGKAYDKKMGNERKRVWADRYHDGGSRKEMGDKHHNHNVSFGCNANTNYTTKGNSKWEGFGTALKPAHEPVVLARKPLSEKTIVENCIKHGTGAIDIDSCRIPINKNDDVIAKNPHTASKGTDAYTQNCYGKYNPTKPTNYKDVSENSGRFPANLLVTDDALNDGEMTGGGCFPKKRGSSAFFGLGDAENRSEFVGKMNDKGSKSRYFDIDVWGEKHGILQFAKSAKKERLINGFNCAKLDEWEKKDENTELAQSLVRDILDLVAMNLSIGGYGNNITDAYPVECLSTTRTEIGRITELKTWNSLMQQPTKDYILDVFGKKTDGGNPVKSAKNSKELMTKIGIFQERVGSVTENVKNATLKLLLKIKEPDAWQDAHSHHPTHKPIHLMSWLIRLVSKEGDTVLDPFMGSGTTGVACKNLNRNFIGIEKEEEYAKIAKARIEAKNNLFD